MRRTSIILSIAALILSLLSLYIAFINPQKDWSANLIATLGVLCTVLIGWQIFSFIDFRSYERRMSELEKRLIEDEKRILATQEEIIKTQEQYIKSQEKLIITQKSIMGLYQSLSRVQGSIYDGISNIYYRIRNLKYFSQSDLLCDEITWLLSDMEVMLSVYSPEELRDILDKIQNRLNSHISLNNKQRDILVKQIDHIIKVFEKSSKVTNPELRKVLDEAFCIIHSIPQSSL